jgi:hypothetical protein
MPHVVVDLLALARRLSPLAALCCVLACSRSGDSQHAAESSDGSRRVEALDTRSPNPSAYAPSAHDAPLNRALADSARRLDSAYQRERSALNAEATAMRSADHHTSAYLSRYRAFEQRAAAAALLRAERDRVRGRLSGLRRQASAVSGE